MLLVVNLGTQMRPIIVPFGGFDFRRGRGKLYRIAATPNRSGALWDRRFRLSRWIYA